MTRCTRQRYTVCRSFTFVGVEQLSEGRQVPALDHTPTPSSPELIARPLFPPSLGFPHLSADGRAVTWEAAGNSGESKNRTTSTVAVVKLRMPEKEGKALAAAVAESGCKGGEARKYRKGVGEEQRRGYDDREYEQASVW